MENKSLISLLEEMNVLCRDNGKRFDEDSPRNAFQSSVQMAFYMVLMTIRLRIHRSYI